MRSNCFLGIDTSNYTTSVSLVSEEGEVLLNRKMLLPVKEGACGLRQSEAVFAHIKRLPQLMEEVREVAGGSILAIGVSEKPRNAEGSYMPCFLAGVNAAVALSSGASLPLYRFSHQCGHLRAAMYAAGVKPVLTEPFGAFHISGGTTELLRAAYTGNGFDAEVIGGSRDLHAGQAVDRIGVLLGLPFPAGPALERLAEENQGCFSPRGTHTEDGYIHLSGLQNLAEKLWKETGDAPLVAAFTLDYLARAIIAMSKYFRKKYGNAPLIYAGGVMSNQILQRAIRKEISHAYFATPAFSTDNAAGIALLTKEAYVAMRSEQGQRND